ncbi:hypothetical protein AY601_1512 [Pedobacter cryoconitis]|uniref:Uncharacterized protein n=1 Tax=Pedobacter cryoconitis TaxID=188932 RepID=A0A127VB28_9SPHI|nr:hypothetical protein [Pedobacter cryoconitis]AMP98429.1 hypothetical protein AY601_1512 [Pedobacter cryoconitis]
MKKIFITATGIVLLLLLAVYGLLQYRQYSSYQNRIHQHAALIFKINVDHLVKKRGLGNLKSDSRGFGVPANIFVYTVSNKSALTFFCSLPVTDTVELKAYLKKVFKMNHFIVDAQGSVWGNSQDQSIKIAYDDKNVVLCYSLLKENVNDIMGELLAGKSFLADTADQVVRLKKEDAPIVYDFKNYSGQASFADHRILLNGTFPVEDFGVTGTLNRPVALAKGLSINAWVNGDLSRLFTKDIRFRDYVLERDSLLKYYKGYAAIEVGNPVNQSQSVISYTYNDEFEKVEQVVQKKVKVPEITLSLKGNIASLVHYLQKKKVIASENQLNKELFPLYEVYGQYDNRMLQLSTNKGRPMRSAVVTTPYFLFAELDFDQIRKQNQFPVFNSYIKDLSSLKVKAIKQNHQVGKVEIELKFTKEISF